MRTDRPTRRGASAAALALAAGVSLAVAGCVTGLVPPSAPSGSAGSPGTPGPSASPVGSPPDANQETSAGAGPGASGAPTTSPGPVVTPDLSVRPLPSLRSRPIGGPRPDLGTLLHDYQYGNPPVALDATAGPRDWRLARPDARMVAGYPGDASVIAGDSLDLHLRSTGGPVSLDVFRMGRDDATFMTSIGPVAAGPQASAAPDPVRGLVEERWPVSTRLAVPATWPSGVYLVKLTARAGGQAYLPFVVRPASAAPLLVVLPTMTYQAYNPFGGADLYGGRLAVNGRAYAVGFDRPYAQGWGAGLFFRLDFPLVVWLEDHGYAPAYATDVDVARDPTLVTGARAVIVSGHAEYWTSGMFDTFAAAQAGSVSLLNMGANEAWWQARLEPGSTGASDRRVVCYKSAWLDPVTASDPNAATTRFTQLLRPRAAADLFGQDYAGIVGGLSPMTLAPAVAAFAPDSGLRPGERLPGLIGDEIDAVSTKPGATILAATPFRPRRRPAAVAGTSAWVAPSGAHVFDAGTFDWSWGLDPRYAAALPDFPAAGFERLMAAVLAWAGVDPTVRAGS